MAYERAAGREPAASMMSVMELLMPVVTRLDQPCADRCRMDCQCQEAFFPPGHFAEPGVPKGLADVLSP